MRQRPVTHSTLGTDSRDSTSTMTDDEALMLAIQAGDSRAYESAVRKHIKAISHYAFRMLGNSKDVEDITQETLLRLWTHADSWQPGKAGVSTWLHRIAHNLCIDSLRKDRSGITGELTEDIETDDDPSIAPSKDAELKALQNALDALPERQRSALILSHYQGFSNKEIAQMMDISVDALESILARARRGLKARLIRNAPEESV